MRIALVTCRRLPDLDPDDRPLAAVLAGRSHQVAAALWDDPAVDWSSFDVAVLRSTWDYFHRRDEFLAWAERAAAATRLWNPLDLVRWNSHKSYLVELRRRGARVIPTEIVPAGSRLDVRRRMAENRWTRAVLKPAVSADAYGTILVDKDGMAAAQAHADALLAERDVMIQPYFESVEAADDERDAATRVLRLAGAEGALYARVDLARDDHGLPCLMELELVEPTLFFTGAPGAADRMADALEARAS